MDEIPASEFDTSSFDAKKVVQHYRKLVPLPQLQRSLRSHHAATRQELVELINEKYADFVSLSSRMQGVERALKPLRAPLEESAELTHGLQTKLGAILDQAGETQKELARVRARKDALAAYIDNAKILDRAKDALAHRWGNPQESDDFLREHVAQENVARELRRIRLNLGGRLGSVPIAAEGPAAVLGAGSSRPPAPPASASGSTATATIAGTTVGGAEGGSLAEEDSPECQALLREASEFEEAFAEKLRERLHSLVSAAKRGWDAAAAGAGDASPGVPAPGPPARAELLAVAHLSRALVTVGRSSVVDATFADVFVKGALEAATAACGSAAEDARRQASSGRGLEGSPGGTFGSGALAAERSVLAVDLGPFFTAVQQTLLVEGAPILWFARRLQSSGGADGGDMENAMLAVPSLHLVPNAVAAPVLRHVQKVWEKSVFMPAFPDIFAANYLHSSKFIQVVEEFMTRAERQSFAQSPTATEFRRRWKTQVYFSLRQKEAVKVLQAVAAKPLQPAGSVEQCAKAAGGDFWLEASAELVRVLHTIWSDRWYLEVLYPKMVQLSLELVAKYGKWVGSVADAPDTPGAGWDASSASASWVTTSLPVRLSRVAADILQIISALTESSAPEGPVGSLSRLVVGRLPSEAAAGARSGSGRRPDELVRALLDEAAAELRPVVQRLEACILRSAAAAATPQFAAIRGIPALYRMLSKPVPTQASPYVESAMRPILALRQATAAAPADTVARWACQAADTAALEFSMQASQLLESTKLQEASLKRLGGRSTGGGETQVSDLDKIHIQLCLDAEAFSNSAAALGARPEGGNGLAKLAEVVVLVRPTYEAHHFPPAQAAS